jgi:hypothetical protein
VPSYLPFSSSLLITCQDPGKNTGLSLLRATYDSVERLDSNVVGYVPKKGITPLNTMKRWLAEFPGETHIFVYENFHIRPGVVVPDTTAIDVITASLEWIQNEKPYVKVVPQEPAQGKKQVPDDVLKTMGFHLRGGVTRHANDATRHGVAWLIGQRHRPTARLAFPPRH